MHEAGDHPRQGHERERSVEPAGAVQHAGAERRLVEVVEVRRHHRRQRDAAQHVDRGVAHRRTASAGRVRPAVRHGRSVAVPRGDGALGGDVGLSRRAADAVGDGPRGDQATVVAPGDGDVPVGHGGDRTVAEGVVEAHHRERQEAPDRPREREAAAALLHRVDHAVTEQIGVLRVPAGAVEVAGEHRGPRRAVGERVDGRQLGTPLVDAEARVAHVHGEHVDARVAHRDDGAWVARFGDRLDRAGEDRQPASRCPPRFPPLVELVALVVRESAARGRRRRAPSACRARSRRARARRRRRSTIALAAASGVGFSS